MTTAASASRSSRPKTRSSASPTAPSTCEIGATVSASSRARAPRPAARAAAPCAGSYRTAKASAPDDAEPVERVGPADERGLARAAGERPLHDARDPELHEPVGRRDGQHVAQPHAQPLGARPRQDHRPAGVDGRERVRARRPR